MGIIKTSKLVHEFIRRDEEGNVESITTALDNVNLDIKEGQFIAILGHNGSGKSTLAKHINALLAPSDGTIWVDGMDVSKEENVIPVRKSAGMVFQNPDNQIIANVVEEDVGFGPENIGVPTDEIWQRVDYALRAVGMTKYRTHSPNMIVVDDLALPFGTLRLKGKGSDAGHNGLKHIAATLGTQNYARLRFGIGSDFPRGGQIDYVLGHFTHEDWKTMDERLGDVAKMQRGQYIISSLYVNR